MGICSCYFIWVFVSMLLLYRAQSVCSQLTPQTKHRTLMYHVWNCFRGTSNWYHMLTLLAEYQRWKTFICYWHVSLISGTVAEPRVVIKQIWGGADKSSAGPGRKQATATKLARRLTFFLSASVTRKVLQLGTWTDPSFQWHYRFRPTTTGKRSG